MKSNASGQSDSDSSKEATSIEDTVQECHNKDTAGDRPRPIQPAGKPTWRFDGHPTNSIRGEIGKALFQFFMEQSNAFQDGDALDWIQKIREEQPECFFFFLRVMRCDFCKDDVINALAAANVIENTRYRALVGYKPIYRYVPEPALSMRKDV